MNLERFNKIPKRSANQEGLAQMSWNLADRLSSGRWRQRRIQEVQLHRSVTEKIGREVMSEAGGLISPVFQDIVIDFSAKKFTDDYDVDVTVGYQLSSTVTQDLESYELPPHVIRDMFDDSDDDEDDEELEDIFGADVRNPEEVDWSSYDLKREQTVEYQYDAFGEIETYGLTYRYLIDDSYVHETTYDSDEGLRVTAPVRDGAGEVIDERPAILLSLTEANVPMELSNLDKQWWDFMDETAMHEMLHLGGQSSSERAVQAMRTLALLSSGLFTVRDLLRR